MDGWCTDEDGGRLGDFEFLGNVFNADECMATCKGVDGATGCEFLFESMCYVHTRYVASSSGQFFFDHSFEAKCIAFSGKTSKNKIRFLLENSKWEVRSGYVLE